MKMCIRDRDKLEAYKDGNLLKGGIVFADAITTVSSTYAEEIKMPFYGEGLDGLMRARADSLRGIVNGIDSVSYTHLVQGTCFSVNRCSDTF